MSELESLALLIAEMSAQNRALLQENAVLRKELQGERERELQREGSETSSDLTNS